MSVSEKVLDILEKNRGKYISGGEIADELGVSRNSVWKAVRGFQNDGYDISAVTNKGYMLMENSDIISAQSINKYIENKAVRIEYCKSVTSTNTLAKQRAEEGAEEGLVIVSSQQTQGRGRRGRTFYSPSDTGVYFSVVLRPDMSPEDSLLITTCAAVAVTRSLDENTDCEPSIKWVNDVFVNGKKVCGILTEASFDLEGNRLAYAVLGIGINVYPPSDSFPDEIKNIASSVFPDRNNHSDMISKITADIINIFFQYYSHLSDKSFLDEYRRRCFVIGEKVYVIKNGERKEALALSVDDALRLNVIYPDGTKESLSSGEISIRPKMQ